jgi:hypothetical protein
MRAESETEVRVLPEVTVNDELAKAVQAAVSATDIRALLVAEAEKQGAASAQLAADQAAAEQARATAAAAEQAAAQAAAAAAQTVTRSVNIAGTIFNFEGASEAEVDRLELNALKIAYAVREEKSAAVEPVPDAAAVAAAAEAEVAAKADLERKFRLGEVSASDYIQQSGALTQFLESNGISIDALKETVNEKLGAKVAQSWAQAGEVFRNSLAGADWPGGDRNQEIIGLKLAAMGLIEAPDKVAAITQAYAALKQSRAYFPYGDFNTEAEWKAANGQPVAAATVPDPAVAAAAAAAVAAQASAAADAARVTAALKTRSSSSSMWGQSAGLSGAAITDPAVAAAKSVIPADASPAEILRAYTESQIAAGISPDAAFIDAHRAKKI